jgi:hypothetical protein
MLSVCFAYYGVGKVFMARPSREDFDSTDLAIVMFRCKYSWEQVVQPT